MQSYQFPGTDLNVSRLCFGCWGITSDFHWGDRVESESIGAMKAAIDSGVNFFDTAPMYGDGASEQLLGKFLNENSLRQQVVVASKIRPANMSFDQVIAECEESLTRLGTDYLDLYQTHWTHPEIPISETWGAMVELKKQGKVRHIGVCNAGVNDLDDVAKTQRPLTNQLPYNLISRMIEFEIQPKCVQQQIGMLVYSPLMHGMLADKYRTADEVPDGRARSRHFSSERSMTRHGEPGCESETFAAIEAIRQIASESNRCMAELALCWTLAQVGIVSVIAGARNAEQSTLNAQWIDNVGDSELHDRLSKVTEELKQKLGPNADLWDGGVHSRYR